MPGWLILDLALLALCVLILVGFVQLVRRGGRH